MDIQLFEEFVRDRVAKDLFSGSVLVAKGTEILFELAVGYANKVKNISNTVDTKFNLGSANKMFTAVAIAQLAEKGLLAFDDTVGKHLPEYSNTIVKEEVTIDQLLTHRGGLGSFIDLKYREEFLAARHELKSISDVLRLFESKPLEFPAGEFHYSSNGYELLGAIIESVSKQNYYDYIREHIFLVADMPNTDSYEISPARVSEDIAIGYTNRDPKTDQMLEGDRFDNFGLNLFKGTASGSGYSTCHDMLHFADSLKQYRLMGENMTKNVLSPKVKEGSKGSQTKYYCYGFQSFDLGNTTRIGHPGRFSGVNVRFDMYPDSGYVVIVLANYDPPSAFDIAEKASELI
jgi:CubicO group peptidase (beta-lactamase class C family)